MYPHPEWGDGAAQGSSNKKPSTLNQPADALPAGLQAWYHGVNRVWCLDEAHKKERLFRFYTASHCALVTAIDHHLGTTMKTFEGGRRPAGRHDLRFRALVTGRSRNGSPQTRDMA
jgi:hypothetical protein